MSRRAVQATMVLAVLTSAFVSAEESGDLAARLPLDKTAVFVQLDVKRTLEEMRNSVMIVDPDVGAKIVYEMTNLWGAVQELAGSYEFEPALLDRLGEIEVSLVLMLKDEPEVKVSTFLPLEI